MQFGRRSSIGIASGCDSEGCRFEAHRQPHIIQEGMISEVNSGAFEEIFTL